MSIETPDDSPPDAHAEEQPAEAPDVEFEEPESVTPTPEVEADASDTEYAEDVAYEPPADLTTPTSFEAEQDVEPAEESRTIQIDLTPVIMLLIGLGIGFLAGFVGRPMLVTEPQLPVATATTETVEQPSPPAESEAASQASAVTPETVAQQAPATEAPATPDPAASATAAAEREAALQDIMQTLVTQTRHFKGDPDAPVTILEFSDFQ